MNDLRYMNEENIKNLNQKLDQNEEIRFQLDGANKTVITREHQIVELKKTIVQGEIKARRLLEQLNENITEEAQENIDSTLNVLSRKFKRRNDPSDHTPDRVENQKKAGFISNADHRLQSLLNVDRPVLTKEVALKELMERQRKEEEDGGKSFSFEQQLEPSPA